MKNYRAIIVEDELLPRLSLLQKLETYYPYIEVVDCCESYETALTAILRHRPDILFLDIQLQGHTTTLELLCELKEAITLPHIIFTTAFKNSDYLLQAIRFAAADYLLKPVNLSDLAKAIHRIEERDAINLSSSTQFRVQSEKVPFHTLNGILYAGRNEVVYLRANGNYSNMVLTEGEEIVLERLGIIESKLDKRDFIRAGRNLLLNCNFIYKINRKHRYCILRSPTGREYKVELSSGGLEAVENYIKP